MIKASISLQELRRRIYNKAKTVGWKKWSREVIYTIYLPESNSKSIGHINLVAKRAGKPYEGKPHVRFEVAGAGNVLRCLGGAPVFDPNI